MLGLFLVWIWFRLIWNWWCSWWLLDMVFRRHKINKHSEKVQELRSPNWWKWNRELSCGMSWVENPVYLSLQIYNILCINFGSLSLGHMHLGGYYLTCFLMWGSLVYDPLPDNMFPLDNTPVYRIDELIRWSFGEHYVSFYRDLGYSYVLC